MRKHQASLFDEKLPPAPEAREVVPPPPHNGKEVSVARALNWSKGKAAEARRRLIGLFEEVGAEGLTRQEAMANLAMEGDSLRPRWWECELGGYIENTGKKRPNRNGNPTEIYVRTDRAIEEA